jgi:Hydrogenase/urease nickel incorporation, metallochaperone, hypA
VRQTELRTRGRATRDEPLRELSIAQSLADVAERHATGRPIRKVEVSVGRSLEVDPDLLRLAFSLIAHGTALDGTELQIVVPDGDELLIDALELEERATPSAVDGRAARLHRQRAWRHRRR